MLTLRILNRQKTLPLDRRRLRRAIRAIVQDAKIPEARINLAVVDDPAIAALHQRYMDDPDPTDVLSFVLERTDRCLEGEVVVSADTARSNAVRYRSTPEEELLLYTIHGSLHLVGYDDTTPRKRAVMRKMEKKYLSQSE
jgi:probable rRNA maturation factor